MPTTKALALLLIFRFKEGAQVLIVLEANILLFNFGGRRYLRNLFVNCLSVADILAAHLTRIAVGARISHKFGLHQLFDQLLETLRLPVQSLIEHLVEQLGHSVAQIRTVQWVLFHLLELFSLDYDL